MANVSSHQAPRVDLFGRIAEATRRFRSEGGNVVIIFALTLPLLIGGAAFGVETSYWYLKEVQLQAAADAAAYAGVIEKRAGSSNATITSVATQLAVSNGFDSSIGTIAVHTPPTSGANQAGLAVEVILNQPVQRYFTKLFSNSAVIENARAVAAFTPSGNACILALNPTKSKSILFSGNSSIDVKGCEIMSNSNASDAIKTQGSSTTKAGCLISAGGVDLSGGTVTLGCPHAVSNAMPIPDPFANVPEPTASGPCLSGNGSTLSPGKYCSGLDLKNTVTMNAGMYYISGGDLKVNANANISGNGVTIYLAGASRVSMNGNSTVVLSAPTSGNYAGILFFGDRANSGATMNTFNGNSAAKLTGFLYFKTQGVRYLGNLSGVKGCTRIVADNIDWTGNSTIDDTQDCASLGLKKVPSSLLVTLAE
jgi:hypothetical protein